MQGTATVFRNKSSSKRPGGVIVSTASTFSSTAKIKIKLKC